MCHRHIVFNSSAALAKKRHQLHSSVPRKPWMKWTDMREDMGGSSGQLDDREP
jgi:hypothetical protein